MISIDVSTHPVKRGSYGRYFRVEEDKGVKVLHDRYPTPDEAKNSGAFQAATQEAGQLTHMNETNITPKCFGTTVVEIIENGAKAYSIGIILEHLGEMQVESAISQKLLSENEYENVHKRNLLMALQNAGVEHTDMHRANVMFHNGRCYVIDFSPGHFRNK